jgi:hypothetical protein
MYVQPTDPLPRNSQDPLTACEIARAQATVNAMEQAVANAQAASASIAGPSSFAQFGPAVVIDVARSQNGMASAGIATLQPSLAPNIQMELMAAPKVLPLNVTVQEYSGCSTRGSGPLQPIRVVPQVVTMPARAPEPIAVPQNASAPQYKNLCWALRNGMVTQDQFDPSEYMALYVACSQKGYAGGCPPPPLVALWLDQQRRAGTLPHITVRPSDLDAIPQAPNLQAKSCAEAKALEGLSGYRRGLGAIWGDAGSLPTTAAWPDGSSAASGVNWRTLLLFGALGVGLYMAGRR